MLKRFYFAACVVLDFVKENFKNFRHLIVVSKCLSKLNSKTPQFALEISAFVSQSSKLSIIHNFAVSNKQFFVKYENYEHL